MTSQPKLPLTAMTGRIHGYTEVGSSVNACGLLILPIKKMGMSLVGGSHQGLLACPEATKN